MRQRQVDCCLDTSGEGLSLRENVEKTTGLARLYTHSSCGFGARLLVVPLISWCFRHDRLVGAQPCEVWGGAKPRMGEEASGKWSRFLLPCSVGAHFVEMD